MKLRILTSLAFVFIAKAGFAVPITFPGGSLVVPATSSAPVSFTFPGTLTSADTIGFLASGNPTDPCLQTGPAYCTNPAGIVTVAGTSPVGSSSTFVGTFGTTTDLFDFGSLIIILNNQLAEQVFQPNVANGFGSNNPPTSLTLPPTSLAALGFGSFSFVNPTIGFIIADTFRGDNTGSFLLTQGTPTGIPEPGGLMLLGAGLLIVVVALRWLVR